MPCDVASPYLLSCFITFIQYFPLQACDEGWIAYRLRLKCDGTRTETRFRLSAKRASPFKSAGGVSYIDYWQPRCVHQR